MMETKEERLTNTIIKMLKKENCTIREAKIILEHIAWVIEEAQV